MNARRSEPSPLPRLRVMQEADLPAIVRIESAAYPFPWSVGVFRDCLRASYSCWVLESDDERLLGYTVLSTAADESHLLNLCVAPDCQGLGYGRHLVVRMLEVARWSGAQRLFLEVRPSNPAAQSLYLSLGFQEIGRRPRYYPAVDGREDAIVMSRSLVSETRGVQGESSL